MINLVIKKCDNVENSIKELNDLTHEWTLRAARGEHGWTCADCCASFSEGMPDKCAYNHDACTRIIQRDKLEAGLK